MSQVMSDVQDNDYPDLDLTTSSQESQLDDIQEHLVGRPPESDDDCSDENGVNDSFVSSGTGTGSEPFPIDDYEYTVIPRPEPLPAMHDDLVANAPDDAATVELTALMGDPSEIVKILFTSCLASFPQKLKGGFDPEDLNRCVSELLGFDLISMGVLLLGEKIDQLANRSKTEVAHALTKDGWLECKNSRFYPVLPESELETIASLIEGSEKLAEREDKKKKQAETYANVESEERALLTFNMIVELMNAVRETIRNNKVPYQKINQAFMDMVLGEKHKQILNKYLGPLGLTPDMRWNSAWFNKFTNRSALKKLVQMAKFSEIVVTDTSHFYFRADDDGNRPVRMFTDADIQEVRDKWASGNERNTNYGNNVGRGGQRGDRNGSSYQQQPKRQIEADPNYRSSTFAGGISATYDDGSLESSTSTRQRENQPSTSARAFRRTPSSSPVRQEITAADTRFAHDQSSGSRTSSPEPTPRTQVPNPFGGIAVQRRIEEERRQGATGSHGGGYQSRPTARVQDYGETSSEGEITSDGSYSDEDEASKADRKKKRVDLKKKKEERERRRRERHALALPVVPATRFQSTSFYRGANESEEPEGQSQVDVPASDREDAPADAPAAASAPSQTAPVVQQSSDPTADNESTAPLSVMSELPLVVSSSLHDDERIQAQLPYRPADGVLERNKAIEEEKKKREELSDRRARSLAEQSGRPPAQLQHPLLNARGVSSQDPSRQYSEPLTTNGFAGARNHAQPTVTPPQAQPNTEDQYHGRNRQGPRPTQQAPLQQASPQQAPTQPLQQLFQQQPYQNQPQPPIQPQYQQSQQPFQPSPQYAQQPQQYIQQQQQQFQGAPQYNYPQNQQQPQFQPPMQQPQQPMHYNNHYQREQMPMPSPVNQYPHPSSQPMNAPPQMYAPSQQNYGHPNQHYGNRSQAGYMPNCHQPMYNQPLPMGRSNNINFNRPQHSYHVPRPSASITYTSRNDGRGGSNDENVRWRDAVMTIYRTSHDNNMNLYKEDLERIAGERFAQVFPNYFNYVDFIAKEMQGQLVVEYTPNSRIIFRLP